MHQDLSDEFDYSKFDLLCQIFSNTDASGNPTEQTDTINIEDIDSTESSKIIPSTVMSADSTQHHALLKIANNQNLAIEGPPESGKSQTIVNMIVNSIENGKSFILCSKNDCIGGCLLELKSLNLENLVLPVMADPGKSKVFYDSLKQRLEMNLSDFKTADFESLIDKIQKEKNSIKKYRILMSNNLEGTSLKLYEFVGLIIKNQNSIQEIIESVDEDILKNINYSGEINLNLYEGLEDIQQWVRDYSSIVIEPNSIWKLIDSTHSEDENIESFVNSVSKLNEFFLNKQNQNDNYLNFISPLIYQSTS